MLDPAYLASDEDVTTLTAAVELCREIGRQPALSGWMREELYPGGGVRAAAGAARPSSGRAATATLTSGSTRWSHTRM